MKKLNKKEAALTEPTAVCVHAVKLSEENSKKNLSKSKILIQGAGAIGLLCGLILSKKKIPDFGAGDTIKIGVRISEGKRERIQYFEGVCIAKKNRDINSSFTVRKISFGEGVERTFALYSPTVSSIKVVRSGDVRKAKLYYLRDRKGKSARIAEKIKKKIGVDVSVKPEEPKKVAEPVKVEATAEKEASVEKKETSPEVKDEKSTKEKK